MPSTEDDDYRPSAALQVRLACWATFALSVLWSMGGWRIVILAVSAGILAVAVRSWRRQLQALRTFARSDAVVDEDHAEDLSLESKAVAAFVGAGAPHQLAQAYALFEQRHPRGALAGDRQRALALELLDGRFTALGLEALDKTLRAPSMRDDPDLRRRLCDALLDHPAFAVEALAGLDAGAVARREALQRCAPVLRGALEPISADGQVYVLCLDAQGFEYSPEDQLGLAHARGGQPLRHGIRSIGPMEPDEARAQAARRWDAGEPAVVVPAAAMSLTDRVQRIRALHLAQKEARFETDEGSKVVRWDQVVAMIYAEVETLEVNRNLHLESALGRHMESKIYELVDRVEEHREYSPLVEIHIREGGQRLRLDEIRPGIFDYLGRRRQLAAGRNVVLVAKDVVRFAPAARISHGVLGLLCERINPGQRFADASALEEYIRWLRGLDADAVTGPWAVARDALAATRRSAWEGREHGAGEPAAR